MPRAQRRAIGALWTDGILYKQAVNNYNFAHSKKMRARIIASDVYLETKEEKKGNKTMKVTDYYPIFYTEDVEGEAKRYSEDLGYTVKHRPDIENLDYAVLENEQGRRIDLVCSYFPADSFKEGFLGMRANVDNYDEGLEYFEKQGYSMFGTAHHTDSSVTALLTKGDGTYIVLFHHKG